MAAAADRLEQVPLFGGLSTRQRKRLARHFVERDYKPGTTVLREGHMGGVGFFIVVEGEAAVSVKGEEVSRLGPGDHFGALGLISERARTATVTAATHLRCLRLATWDFRRFARENPDVCWKLLQYVVGLLADAEERNAAEAARA